MKKFLIGLGIAIGFLVATSFTKDPGVEINWISVEEFNKLYAKEPRPVMIDLYTSWCGWCKEMDRTTYKHEKLVSYINEHFYAVKYDAESTEKVVFNGKTYHFNPQYRANEFAIFLTGGQLEYPTTIFLADLNASRSIWAGYMKPRELETPLRYFAEGVPAKKTFEEFTKSMKHSWK